MTTTPAPSPRYAEVVTAVGRLLRSKAGEPRVLEQIKVNSEGEGRIVRWEQLEG